MSTILGRFSEYLNMDVLKGDSLPELDEAIETYLDQGGILKVERGDNGDPKLLYPGKDRIKKQLEDVQKKEKYIRREMVKLRRKKKEKKDGGVDSVKKAFSPLYWQHKYKKRTDEDYKEAYDEIQPPIEKLNDPEWRKMLEMFITEPEYRERLLEAARSEIGKGSGTIREEMVKREQFSDDVIQKRMDELQNKLDRYTKKKKALKRLLKIAKS